MNAYALARWFDIPRDASGPCDDLTRELVLDDVMHATAVAVSGDDVLARTPLGACMMRTNDDDTCPLVFFDHVRNDRWTRVTFWMNASSVRDIGNALRLAPRASLDDLFTTT